MRESVGEHAIIDVWPHFECQTIFSQSPPAYKRTNLPTNAQTHEPAYKRTAADKHAGCPSRLATTVMETKHVPVLFSKPVTKRLGAVSFDPKHEFESTLCCWLRLPEWPSMFKGERSDACTL